jgi:twitching motility protein PilT
VPLVTSLLTTIVRADGDALVLHAGERPYVVAPSGQSELASRALTLDAMTGMLSELLTQDARQTLDEVGAVQHDLPSSGPFAGERFTVIAARGGDDIWIEIRRHRKPTEISKPEPPAPAAAPQSASEAHTAPALETGPGAPALVDASHDAPSASSEAPAESAVGTDGESEMMAESELAAAHVDQDAPPVFELQEQPDIHEISFDSAMSGPPSLDAHSEAVVQDMTASEAVPEVPIEPEPRPAVVVPLSRNQKRPEQPVPFSPPLHTTGIDRLLRIAAARGASMLYLTSQARPSIRVDGGISPIEGEAVLSEPDVENLILDIIPERNRETLRSQAGTEWICDVPDVGRIRCVTFRDHRGAGGIFRMTPPRAISAEQLGLSREIQALCAEAEGLVLVTGPRSSGKSTLTSAFVDLINRTRSDHVITLENQIQFVHENRRSLVSQREVRRDNHEVLTAARAALRENPDVLVIEELGSPDIVTLALEAAQSGHLVIGALTAHTATNAIDRIIDQAPPDCRPKLQLALAENLRGIIVQVLLRKAGGGRVAAREVVLNTSAVASLIAEGKTSQLSMAVDSGRKHGMVTLNDALVTLVQSGFVESREAYRHAGDQPGFLALLERQGVDTSFVERLA